jgi:hypothetical protein
MFDDYCHMSRRQRHAIAAIASYAAATPHAAIFTPLRYFRYFIELAAFATAIAASMISSPRR